MIEWTTFETGNHRCTCPACGRKASDKTMGVTVDSGGSGVAHCFRCNLVENHRPDVGVYHRPGKPINRPVQAAKHDGLSEYGQDVWRACKPLSGVCLDYLKYRHCAIPPADGDLRYHPALKHPSGYTGPCLVALITDVHTQAPLSLHRTWITATGKADVDPPRLLLKDHSIKNGVIRLWPDDHVGSLLGIAEGLETALSLAHAPLCVWATVDAGHLSKFPVIAGINDLVIAQDQDLAGIAAASACARRWAAAGRSVRVTRQTANDLNDSLAEAK